MARFYFHLSECGTVTTDVEGREIPAETVRDCAVAAARNVMSWEVAAGHLCVSCCISVTDADGNAILSLPFAEALTISGPVVGKPN